jgi:hypothetical protein
MGTIETFGTGVRAIGDQVGLPMAAVPVVASHQPGAVQPTGIAGSLEKERESRDHLAGAHGEVATALAVPMPVDFARRLVDHVPLPHRFDFAAHRLLV